MDLCKECTEIAISSEIGHFSLSILNPGLSIPSIIMQVINSNPSVLAALGTEAGSNRSSREMLQ